MAEEKLEMKADRGKMIYPRQIKRELGAKIIYDAICPVTNKAFYGFNPYEKENYGTMVAEDIGNSYVLSVILSFDNNGVPVKPIRAAVGNKSIILSANIPY